VRPALSAAKPGQSIRWPAPGVGRLGRGGERDRDPESGNRQVHPEDHPPVDFDQQAAGEQADRQRHRRDGGPDPKRPRLFLGREDVADQRQRERKHRRCPHSLQNPTDDQRDLIAGSPGDHRPNREEHYPR
jgi:hypothetical protein